MDALGAHSYDILVKLERKSYYKKKLRRWWSSFSYSDQAFIWRLLRDAIALLHTSLDWSLLEVITSCWDLALRCVTIGDVDLLPTLKEYDRFLSLSTPLSTIFVPLLWPHYQKRLTDLLGSKRPIVETLTWYGSRIGRSMSCDFLYDQFYSLEHVLLGGLFWCVVIFFTIRSCQFCRSPSSKSPTSWCLFHSHFTFWNH